MKKQTSYLLLSNSTHDRSHWGVASSFTIDILMNNITEGLMIFLNFPGSSTDSYDISMLELSLIKTYSIQYWTPCFELFALRVSSKSM